MDGLIRGSADVIRLNQRPSKMTPDRCSVGWQGKMIILKRASRGFHFAGEVARASFLFADLLLRFILLPGLYALISS